MSQSSKSLKILLTNIQLVGPSGTELYIYDVARRLAAMGHTPVIFCPKMGSIAQRLIDLSIPVVDRLDRITVTPDIIHGHHSLETATALLWFPQTPGIFVCHDCSAWHDRPPILRRIRRYLAVDQACLDRLTLREGVPAERAAILQNGVDLRRFRPRSPLPSRPTRALFLSNYAGPEELRAVRQACDAAQIQLDGIGQKFGTTQVKPEETLGQYDLVFAKGRCAWEALAVGAAVIVCDAQGTGPLVTTDRLDHLASYNFGRRLLNTPLTIDHLAAQIARYDANDAMEVSRRVRRRADLDHVAAQLIECYEQAIAEHRTDVTPHEGESRQLAEFLGWWSWQREQLELRQLGQYGLDTSASARVGRSGRLRRWWRSVRKRLPNVLGNSGDRREAA